jgi:hypothetical protein
MSAPVFFFVVLICMQDKNNRFGKVPKKSNSSDEVDRKQGYKTKNLLREIGWQKESHIRQLCGFQILSLVRSKGIHTKQFLL